MTSCAVGDGIVGAHSSAVEAYHTAGGVDGVVDEVDALTFTNALAFAAVYAQVGIYVEMEHGLLRGCPEERADGADSVAQSAAESP